jgi:hypothetical protein
MLKNTVLYKEKQLKIGIFSRPVGMKAENSWILFSIVMVDVLLFSILAAVLENTYFRFRSFQPNE